MWWRGNVSEGGGKVFEMMRKILMENILFDQDSITNHIKYISEKEFKEKVDKN